MKSLKTVFALLMGVCLLSQTAVAKIKKVKKQTAPQAQTEEAKTPAQEPAKADSKEEAPAAPIANETEPKTEKEPSGGGGW